MANEKVEGREMTWRTLFPWTELFRGFQVALDLNKLLLAAAGILVMACGWWLLAVIFGAMTLPKPDYPSDYTTKSGGDVNKGWAQFRHDRDLWNLMHETAKVGRDDERIETADIAQSPAELLGVRGALEKAPATPKGRGEALDALVLDKDKTFEFDQTRAQFYKDRLDTRKPAGTLSTMPWSEDRGPNPFLLVTGQAGIPWEQGHFWDWFLRHQLLVVLEPVVKLVRPLVYFFDARTDGFIPRLYFFLVFLWTVLTWSFFGGAITRIAAVQVARGEKIGLMDAINFTVKRVVSYLTAPLFPIGFILVLVFFLMIFGLFQMIPMFGDLFSGILWVIPLVFSLLIAVTLVGLVVGWPLMSPTISAEGTDSWEAVSRSFSYVFQKPFHYLWYCLVAACYGAILIFFIGFMGSFTVYLSKWAVSQTPFISMANREPTYLMVYAPESFGWRTLLLQGAKVDGQDVVRPANKINPARPYAREMEVDSNLLADYKSEGKGGWHAWNTLGAGLMAVWLGLIFLMVIGFGYSFFWSSMTIIYMLMRKTADGAELDEVHLDEDDTDGVFSGSLPTGMPPPAPAPKPTAPVTMLESPSLRSSPAITPMAVTPPVSTPANAPITESAPVVTEPPPGLPKDGLENPPA